MEYPRATTSSTLLESLKDAGNDAVWRQFDSRYRPIVTAVARRMGLSDEDAAEVAQQTLTEFVRAYRAGKYERGRGRLSSWIIGIAQYRATDVFRAQAARREQRGQSALVDLSVPDQWTKAWEAERRRAILAEAIHVLRTHTRVAEPTVRAFELVALRGVPAEQAAVECGLTVDEVYVAKNRVIARLRTIVDELTAAYDEET